MTRCRLYFAVVAAAALMLIAQPVLAHQQKSAVTRVLFNERTGNIEVMHRFYLHDAEHAVRRILGKSADILGSERTQRRFSEYVAQRFVIRDGAERLLALEMVGWEVDGKFVWVYQETPIPDGLDALVIQQQALRDIWPSQVNLVNVEGRGAVKSLRFRDDEERQRVSIAAEDPT